MQNLWRDRMDVEAPLMPLAASGWPCTERKGAETPEYANSTRPHAGNAG
jgi:hypothetical protein